MIPCEGGLAYEFARKISSERMLKKHFHMEYKPIRQAEHINTFDEIAFELKKAGFVAKVESFFPLLVKIPTINLCWGARLVVNN